MKKYAKWLVPLLGILACYAAYTALPRWFIINEINRSRAQGEYANPEEGLLALMDKSYSPDHTVKIYSAGPDAHDGSKPYVWYVIAEVRASARADGSEMGRNGCDNPGHVLHPTEGWEVGARPRRHPHHLYARLAGPLRPGRRGRGHAFDRPSAWTDPVLQVNPARRLAGREQRGR